MWTLSRRQAPSPRPRSRWTSSRRLCSNTCLQWLWSPPWTRRRRRWYHLAGGWLSALKCPAFDLMIGLGVLLRLWRTYILLSLWAFVCLSPVSLSSLSVIVIINIIITIKGGRLVLCLRRGIMRSLLRQKWSSSFMMIIISWAIKHYDDNQLFDGHHRFWRSSFLGRSNIMMIISSLMFIKIILFSRWFIP